MSNSEHAAPIPLRQVSSHNMKDDASQSLTPAIESRYCGKDDMEVQTETSSVLTGTRLALTFAAILLSSSLFALDQTILATALPRIASDFDAFSLQGWVATSFVLAQTVFILFYGQVSRIYSAKWTLIAAIGIFEVGSLVCGVAQNVEQLIAGRTVSGMGAAGIFVGMIQIVSQFTRLEDRPKLFAMFGVVFGVSTVIGPLIGGAFADRVTWRWCFFINLPMGGLSVAVVALTLKAEAPLGSDPSRRTIRDLWMQTMYMDFVGATLVAAAVTCLVLALQWGGNTKSWSDKDVIICFVFASILIPAYVFWEHYLGEKAMAPLQIFKSYSIYAIVAYSLLTRFSLLLFSYYIPIFYQAARHSSATSSGIDLLPFMLGCVLTIVVSSQLIGRFGYYWPFLICAPVFLAIGSGLLYSLNERTSEAKLIGFQILAGIGVGMGMQNILMAIQVEFNDQPKLIGQATSMVSFAQFLGGTLGLGIAEPVFASKLSSDLAKYAPAAPQDVVKQTPTAIYTSLPNDLIPGVVHAYTESLRLVFVLGVPAAGLGLLAAAFIRNIKMTKAG